MNREELQVPVLIVTEGCRCWIGRLTGVDRCPHLVEVTDGVFNCRLFGEPLTVDFRMNRPIRAAACQMQAQPIRRREDRR